MAEYRNDIISKYKGIPDTRPIVERGTVILTEAGKTAVLVGRE